MLVKQSFRVHQIIPHIAKKKKKAISFQSTEIDSLAFWWKQSERKLVWGKSRFYNK